MSEHGTYVRYTVGGCRCDACRAASREYGRELERRLAVERWHPERSKWVDAEPVRQHLRALSECGMGFKRVARIAGVPITNVGEILWGRFPHDPTSPEHRPPRRRVLRTTAERLLAVTADLAPGAVVKGTGTRRRLQALVTVGWSQAELARRLGMPASNFGSIIHGRRDVTHATTQAVRALYDELWDQAPPVTTRYDRVALSRSRRYAAERDWVPPMAWDDELIDDPTAQPDLGGRGHGSAVERIRELVDLGYALPEVEHRLGRGRGALYVALKREGALDVWERLQRDERRIA